MAYLAPSILSADLLKFEEQLRTVEQNGADYLHIDVMDGRFVPNITFGPVIVKAADRACNLPLDVHLMIENPENYIHEFARAGAHIITVHQETCLHLDSTLNMIEAAGCKTGVSLNPATPVETLKQVLHKLDLVLIMSVNPGFGAQKLIPYTLEKIRQLKILRDETKSDFLIEVDGGINQDTASSVLDAGADILVAGNAVFNQESIAQACKNLKQIISSERQA